MSHVMKVRLRNALLFCTVLALGAFGPALAGRFVQHADAGDASPAPAADTRDSVLFVGAAPIDTAMQDIAAERRTAIVRAAERVAPAVVSVSVVRREAVQPRTLLESMFIPPGAVRESEGLGSGSIIDARGLVLTNEHVVRGATEIIVTLRDGRQFNAAVAGSDEVTDLALLRLQDITGTLPVAPLGTSRDLLVGEWAIAIGNPYGYLLSNAEPTVTAGVISGLNRNIIQSGGDGSGYYLDMIQTDASINPGNSGGPLVNALGQVIGVNSSIISGAGGSIGLGFAIPIDRAKRIAADLLTHGKVRRVWVGADVEDDVQSGRGRLVRVARVTPGSPAAAAGLREGMIVDRVMGRVVRSALDWEAHLLDARVGEAFEVIASENGRSRTLRVSPQDLPSIAADRVQALDDFTFVTLSPAIRSERRIRSENGALIVSLTDAARRIGLREGDVIVDINRNGIETAEQAASILTRLRGTGIAVRMTIERGGQLRSVSFDIRG
jgi:serine protease Do